MQAIVCPRYGSPSVLKLAEVPKPAPKPDEVLVRVRASSINSRDWRMLRANPFFLRFMTKGLFRPNPSILGADVAGVVEAVGAAVKEFRPGDEVFGCLHRYNGQAFAEYVCAPEKELALKPAGKPFEQAAAVPLAALTALHGLRNLGKLQPGQKVLIQGASGGVGGFAVQLARAMDADVTGVCSTRNLELARSFGAGHVIDYRKEDFTLRPERYDLILAVNGYHPLSHYLRVLKPDGSHVVAGGSMLQLAQAAMQSKKNSTSGGQKAAVVADIMSKDNLLFIKGLLEAGKLNPVIDATYPLKDTAQAFRHYENQHPQGKIVITIR
jgi:NADPH:quinone reductase-like Zn-dependent oxidoreductase